MSADINLAYQKIGKDRGWPRGQPRIFLLEQR